MYAQYVEDTQDDDMDTFLTKVSTMPQISQNKLLHEKLLLVNEKLTNMFEEIV
jgi:hypothetical protein